MADYTITAGSTTPVLTGPLTYADGTIPILAGATVQLVLRNQDASSVYLTGTCTVVGNVATYTWAAGDTMTPGYYLGQFLVTYADTTVQSFPSVGYFTVTITPQLTGSAQPRPDYYTTADLISDVRGYVDGRVRPARNKLLGDLDAVSATVALKYAASVSGASIPAGTQISIGLETMYVWSATGTTLTVERGVDGTSAEQHADGDMILVNPEFTNNRIFRAINDELRSLPGDGIYATKAVDRTMVAQSEGYDVASDVLKVVDVRWQHKWDPTSWTAVTSWEVQDDMPTSVFPSGTALFIPERPFRTWPNNVFINDGSADRSLRIRYFAPLGLLGSLFDDVLTVTGIPTTALDIPAMGAALRLMAGRPVQRVLNYGQPDARTTAETRVADVVNSTAALRAVRQNRITQESSQLTSNFPYRSAARRLMT